MLGGVTDNKRGGLAAQKNELQRNKLKVGAQI